MKAIECDRCLKYENENKSFAPKEYMILCRIFRKEIGYQLEKTLDLCAKCHKELNELVARFMDRN